MNELVVNRLGGVDKVKSYAASLQNMAATLGTDFDGKSLLRLNQETGEWAFGKENVPLEPADLLAINPLSFRHGYIAFDGKALAETLDGAPAEMLVPLSRPLPREEDLPGLFITKKSGRSREDREPRWMPQVAFDLIVVEGPNKGEQLTYKQTSYGGLKLAGKLARDIGSRLGADDEMCVPVIELFTSEYRTKDHGKLIVNPEAAIVEWCDINADTFDSRPEEPEASRQIDTQRGTGSALASRRDDARNEPKPAVTARGRGRPRLTDEEREANADRRSTQSGRVAHEAPRARNAARGRDDEIAHERDRNAHEAPHAGNSARGRDDEVDRAHARAEQEPMEERAPARRTARGRDEEEQGEVATGRGRTARGRRA